MASDRLMEGLALQLLLLDSTYWYVLVGNAVAGLTCLLWLAVVVALARRGQTPASVVIRRRWVDSAGKPACWGPLGSLSFWIGATPALFASLLFAEDVCLAGPQWAWGVWPLFFLALFVGTNVLLGTLPTVDWWSNILVGIAPTVLWLAVVLALAWRGQTVGQALLSLQWVSGDGRPARWRAAGELQFWCAGPALLLGGGPYLLVSVWGGLVWVLMRAHIGLGLPGIWGNGVLPGLSASAIIALSLMSLSRRRPAHLVCIAR